MNIILRELKANLKSLLIWSAVAILFMVVSISKFSAFATDPSLISIMDEFPAALLETFQLTTFNMTQLSGFMGIMFPYLALMVSIYAAFLGSDIISKEERDRTVEFSLTLPISRSKVITGKLIASVILCVIFDIVIAVATLAFSTSYQNDPAFYPFFLLYMVGLLVVQLVFLSIGFLLGCALKEYKRASSIAVSLLLGTYFISIASGINENLDFLKYFSPFKYIDTLKLLNESKFEMVFLWIALGVIVLSLSGAYLTYAKRDLYI